MLVPQSLAVILGLVGLSLAAPKAPHGHKHGENIKYIDDNLKSILPADWNYTKPLRYFSCGQALKNGETLPDFCLQIIPDNLKKTGNFTASPPEGGAAGVSKRDAWVGPIRNPWGNWCRWQANAEYSLALEGTYIDADWVALVNNDNENERWSEWLMDDDTRDRTDWSWYYLKDLRYILYVVFKRGKTYTFDPVTFQIHEKGETWRNMKNGASCWSNEWNTLWGRRSLYQCAFPCSALLW